MKVKTTISIEEKHFLVTKLLLKKVAKTDPNFEQKKLMFTIIANLFDPKKMLLELNPTKLGLKPLIKF